MAANFNLQHTQTSDSILNSLFMLSDSENMGNAVGISLLFYSIRIYSAIKPLHNRDAII